MKKLAAHILLVCILVLPLFVLASCDDTATPPAETQPVVITPSGNDTPSTPSDSETPETPSNPETPSEPETPAAPNEIKNIILIIGDGMGLDHIAAGQLMYGETYGFTQWQYTLANTDSVDSAGMVDQSGSTTITTDSAAAGTALATGKLTTNYSIGRDHTGANLTTILDVAKSLNKSTGVLTTDVLHGATPSAFSAHAETRYETGDIVVTQMTSNVDLMAGHIDAAYTRQKNTIIANGYAYCDDFSKVDETMTSAKAWWQLDIGGDNSVATSATVSLKSAAVKALDFLDRDEDGFALMIEQAHVDKFAHANEFRNTAWAVQSLNNTVEAILAWLGDRTDTAIVITSDHETGGLSVSLENRYNDLVRSSARNEDGSRRTVYYNFSSTGHTNAKVGVFVYGVDADFSKLSYYGAHHTIKNTDVYRLLEDILKHPVEYGKRAA